MWPRHRFDKPVLGGRAKAACRLRCRQGLPPQGQRQEIGKERNHVNSLKTWIALGCKPAFGAFLALPSLLGSLNVLSVW